MSSFPPGATGSLEESRWNCFIEAKDALLSVLGMPLSIPHLYRRGRTIAHAFRRARPRRPRQLQQFQDTGPFF